MPAHLFTNFRGLTVGNIYLATFWTFLMTDRAIVIAAFLTINRHELVRHCTR